MITLEQAKQIDSQEEASKPIAPVVQRPTVAPFTLAQAQALDKQQELERQQAFQPTQQQPVANQSLLSMFMSPVTAPVKAASSLGLGALQGALNLSTGLYNIGKRTIGLPEEPALDVGKYAPYQALETAGEYGPMFAPAGKLLKAAEAAPEAIAAASAMAPETVALLQKAPSFLSSMLKNTGIGAAQGGLLSTVLGASRPNEEPMTRDISNAILGSVVGGGMGAAVSAIPLAAQGYAHASNLVKYLKGKVAPEAIPETIHSMIKARNEVTKLQDKANYEEVDNIAKSTGAKVNNLPNAKEIAKDILSREEEGMTKLNPTLKDMAQKILNYSNPKKFQHVQQFAKDLHGESQIENNVLSGDFKRLRSAVLKDMEESAAKSNNQNLFNAYRKAQEYHAKQRIPYLEKQIKNIVDQDIPPTNISKILIKPSNDKILQDLGHQGKNLVLHDQLSTIADELPGGLNISAPEILWKQYQKIPEATRARLIHPFIDKRINEIGEMARPARAISMAPKWISHPIESMGLTAYKSAIQNPLMSRLLNPENSRAIAQSLMMPALYGYQDITNR